MEITGTWVLESWRRFDANGGVSAPFGEKPEGMLIYAPDGNMAVMMVPRERPRLDTDDPLGGCESERARAYSSCLAYVGRYHRDGETVVHELEASLFPNWSHTSQARPLVLDGQGQSQRLLLQVKDATGRLTNEIAWRRRDEPLLAAKTTR